MSNIAKTPKPPYYAVIFTSLHSQDTEGYAEMAADMVALAQTQPGFLGIESVYDRSGLGITASYWDSEESIRNWKQHLDHLEAQKLGRERWYAGYSLRVSKVERAYEFERGEQTVESSRENRG